MNIREQAYRIQLFERQFIQNANNNRVQVTEANILPTHNNELVEPQSVMILADKLKKKNSKNILQNLEDKSLSKQTNKKKSKNYKYQFKAKLYLFEILIAYALSISLMYLNKVILFPFFQALMVLIIGFSFLPFKITNLFILLGIPMAIANYNLEIWILTYPQIIICFICTYLFTKVQTRNLLWVVTTIIYVIMGFIVLPKISSSLKSQSKIVLYYIYPILLTLIKLGGGLINFAIIQSNLFLNQISLFWMGFSYGMLLTLNTQNIQFWYLLVFLTLDVINTRYQFSIELIKRLANKEHQFSEIEARCSGYAAINSYHLIILTYIVIYQKLNSGKFQFDLTGYVNQWYKPLVIWVFFSIYESITIFRLNKNQKIMIIGYKANTYYIGFLRALSLSLGLWFFYLGLCIPSQMFFL